MHMVNQPKREWAQKMPQDQLHVYMHTISYTVTVLFFFLFSLFFLCVDAVLVLNWHICKIVHLKHQKWSETVKDKQIPWKSSQPCGIHDHHIHTTRKIGTSQHHSRESCDRETTSPDNKDFVHKPCSFCHQPVPKCWRSEKFTSSCTKVHKRQ